MQDSEKLSREEVVKVYQEDACRLFKFIPWLQKTGGNEMTGLYKGEGIEENSMPVPVYDATLLSFVKEAKNTKFMDRNYVYTFSKYRLRSIKDELDLIENCSLLDVKILGDILSKYILKGEVKGAYWAEGVKSGVFLALLLKLKELLDIKKPLV